MYDLRPYQSDLIFRTRQSLAKHRRVIMQAPTGAGKSLIIGEMARLCSLKGSKVLVVAHRTEIVTQNAEAIAERETPCSIISPKTRSVPTTAVSSAMAQTLLRRVEKDDWAAYLASVDMLIIDEAHDSSANFLFDHISKDCYVVGFTATPVRYGNQRQLGYDYNDIVLGPQVQDLINLGFLCRCRLFSLDAPKMDDVDFDYGRGDYSLAQMANKFKSKARYTGTVDNWERIAKGTKTIVFCCSSEQTIEITKEFVKRGYRAKYCLSGSFDEDIEYSGERKELLDSFSRGEFEILVSLGILTAGWNEKSVKTCVTCYSTISVTKWLQSLGRCSRPHPSKNGEFLLLDMGANFEKLGRYEDNRKWYLFHNTGRGGGAAPTKICPEEKGGCSRLLPIQVQDCPFCGYHFPTKQEEYEVELQEIIAKPNNGPETIQQYAARKKLEGWSNPRILASLCAKNPNNQKEVFMKAIEVLNTNHGAKITPQYYYFFKKNILSKKK